jgi:uroporphyrinogen decarboxylase
MKSRERFIAGILGKKVDRVPVTPDISNMIPAKMTGLPFWDIYFYEKVPLWKAYLESAQYFGIDAWIASSTVLPIKFKDSGVNMKLEDWFEKDRMYRKRIKTSSLGTLTQTDMCGRSDPPTPVEKPIKSIENDLDIFLSHQKEIDGLDENKLNTIKNTCHQNGFAFGVGLGYPGFQSWMNHVEDSIMQLSVTEMENPELLHKWYEFDHQKCIERMKLAIEAKPDYILFGGSGTITLSSPNLAMKYAIPSIKEQSAMAKEAGIPTMLHSCGKSRILIDMLVEHTDVNSINPLEIAPMGDVELAEVKKRKGKQIGLMGNIHTTDVMLNGTKDEVYQKAMEALQIAAPGGGFILSTGDQCGLNTPDENIFALVEASCNYHKSLKN